MGHFPLVLVSGPGAEARNSIGIILVAGMFIGTIFTLFILPSVYMWFAETHVTEPSLDADTLQTSTDQRPAMNPLQEDVMAPKNAT